MDILTSVFSFHPLYLNEYLNDVLIPSFEGRYAIYDFLSSYYVVREYDDMKDFVFVKENVGGDGVNAKSSSGGSNDTAIHDRFIVDRMPEATTKLIIIQNVR